MVPQLSVKWSGVKAPVGPGGRITKRTRTLSKDSRRGTAVALDQKVFCIQLSPSNKTVAVSYADGEIRLFDFGTGQNTAVVNPIVKGFAQKQVDFVDAVCEEKMRFPITSLRWKDDSVLISVSMWDQEVSGEVVRKYWATGPHLGGECVNARRFQRGPIVSVGLGTTKLRRAPGGWEL
eukprot:CAMPEP_0179001718 /NCGR_PEP_ID=MMETSP0795-20121207/11539_1 /TAXON_ID=88552 /ORGANISM="Amoebophrya sp., Strain Ameob2" /LENGTH=177 /DNA_ID=CAMNT_0020695169 /DNA_START=232 /DNA_END=766 /DNA_ORIENTATION=+